MKSKKAVSFGGYSEWNDSFLEQPSFHTDGVPGCCYRSFLIYERHKLAALSENTLIKGKRNVSVVEETKYLGKTWVVI